MQVKSSSYDNNLLTLSVLHVDNATTDNIISEMALKLYYRHYYRFCCHAQAQETLLFTLVVSLAALLANTTYRLAHFLPFY